MENPYQAPRTTVADPEPIEYQPVRVFSVSGRIGRVRYIGYSFGLTILFSMVGGILAAALGSAGPVLMGACWIAIIVVSVMLTIQRAHDFDTSGWLAILGLIPLINLIFWFIPGTNGPNRFGAPPPPNSKAAVVVACIVPALFVLGIVAAIALPAYQDYVKRAAAQKVR